MLIDADDKLHKDITLKDVVTLTTYVIKDVLNIILKYSWKNHSVMKRK